MFLSIDTSTFQNYVTLVPRAVNSELKINRDLSIKSVKGLQARPLV